MSQNKGICSPEYVEKPQKKRGRRNLPPPQIKQKLDYCMFSPGFGNVFLCYLLVCSLVLAPVALIFSIRFADSTEQRLFAHYFFIRTTIAVFVIGTCVSCLLILIGADLSSSLILAGLALLTITSALTLVRCFRGIFSALRGNSPRFYRSYLA